MRADERSAQARVTIALRRVAAFALGLHIAALSADSPMRPSPYAVVAGAAEEFLLVMLPGRCEGVQRQVEMSADEYESLMSRSRARRLAQAPQALADDESGCADQERPVGSSLSGSTARVTLERQQWVTTSALYTDEGKPYPASGVYPNDGTTTPLWTVDWFGGEVHVANDGRHLVRLGPWPSSTTELAVAFYDRDTPLRRYAIEDLVSDAAKLPQSISHFQWRADTAFDPARGLLRIHTLSDDAHLFDASTGMRLVTYSTSRPLSARVVRRTGEVNVVGQLHACWSDAALIGVTMADADSLTAGPVDVLSLAGIPRMDRVVSADEAIVRFRVPLPDGGERVVGFPAPAPSLCGVGSDGQGVMVSLGDVNSVVLQP